MSCNAKTDLKFPKGATFRFTANMFVEEDGNVEPLDLTGATVYLCVKKKISDVTPVIDKDSTGPDIVIEPPATDGIVSFVIQSSDTAALDAGQYRYSVWAVLAGGDKKPMVANGSLYLEDVCEVP